jgi:hypothetical protein
MRRERGETPRNLVERLGAALAAPGLAMEHAGSEHGQGRPPADLAVLVLVGFTASHLEPLVRAGWLLVDGQGMGAVHSLLGMLSRVLWAPLLFVAAGGALVTGLAGSRRSIGADFDLACVAAVPIEASAILVELAARAGLSMRGARDVATSIGIAWGAALLVLAVRGARRRPRREEAAA